MFTFSDFLLLNYFLQALGLQVHLNFQKSTISKSKHKFMLAIKLFDIQFQILQFRFTTRHLTQFIITSIHLIFHCQCFSVQGNIEEIQAVVPVRLTKDKLICQDVVEIRIAFLSYLLISM